ncbi:MAG: hypothetical protein AVDCRST_MAG96-1985, partial [uncultured Segetibacter sp.]
EFHLPRSLKKTHRNGCQKQRF